jgi:hypothetical protein
MMRCCCPALLQLLPHCCSCHQHFFGKQAISIAVGSLPIAAAAAAHHSNGLQQQ